MVAARKSPSGKPSGRKTRPVKIPRLEFRHSWIYDQENRLRFTDPLYPSGDRIREYITGISQLWRTRSRTLLNSITRLSGLSWREDSMVCYVVGRGVPMSDPLTIPLYENQPDVFIEKLAYQLVERNILHPGNLKLKSGFWEEMFRSLAEDGIKVSYMVPVNAIYRELQNRYFTPAQTTEASLLTTNLDYKRAWEIVDSLGHTGIIERFRRGEWD